MAEDQKSEHTRVSEQSVGEQELSSESSVEPLKKSLAEINDRYVRLYAEFENYKKFAARSKEEQLKYANENLLKDLLTVIDHLELALQHSSESDSLAEGVELTLKEFKTVLEKYGLAGIEAFGKPFDPSLHHAMTQIETEDVEENTVVKEFRKGYVFKDRVLRASLVGVAKKPARASGAENHSMYPADVDFNTELQEEE
ncbi:MAG: nucleotide exchange factor GrpE [Nitrospirae bacterium]|nr:nucleotide exchange factor GrpE [Nitrospirota bacterium]